MTYSLYHNNYRSFRPSWLLGNKAAMMKGKYIYNYLFSYKQYPTGR